MVDNPSQVDRRRRPLGWQIQRERESMRVNMRERWRCGLEEMARYVSDPPCGIL